MALIENIQREDLNPLEEAQGLQRLIDEFGLTHDAAAKAVGRSRSAVTNLLRLRELAKPVQEYLLAGQLDMGHARALLGLAAGAQTGAAARVVAQGLSVRETERLVAPSGASGDGAGEERRARRRSRSSRGSRRTGRRARREGRDRARSKTGPVASSSRIRASSSSTASWPSCAESFANRTARRRPRPPSSSRVRRAQPSCFSIVSASETSNLPGASMLSVLTTPLSTSIEKRWQRTPMPRALRSSSRPSAFV